MKELQNIPCTEDLSIPTLELGFHCSGGSLHIWIMAGLETANLRTKASRSVNDFGLIWNSGCSERRSLTALVSRLDIIYQSSQLTEIHWQFLCFRNLHCFGEAFVRETPPAAPGGSQRKPKSKGTKGTSFQKQTNMSQVTVNVPALSVPTFPASFELLPACLTLIGNEKYNLARRMAVPLPAALWSLGQLPQKHVRRWGAFFDKWWRMCYFIIALEQTSQEDLSGLIKRGKVGLIWRGKRV